ncbi:MAG: MFS transporter [Lachnospiraceae bacterium]|nr:MFS transporter [Lachnospiraceae bacterium]
MSDNIFSDKTSRRSVFTTYTAFIINGMMALSIGSLLPFIRDDRGLSYAFAGLIVSLHSVGNLISSFMSGALSVWTGRKKSVLIFDFFMPVAYVLILAGKSNLLLAAAFFLTGIARGANSNYCNAVINDIAPGKAWILNGLHAMFSVGAFLFPIILSVLTRNGAEGYRTACVFLLIMGIISFLLYFFSPGDTVSESGNSPAGEDDSAGKQAADRGFGFFREKIFILTVLTLFFYLCAEQGVIGWMVTYFTDTGYISSSLSQITAGILWIMMLIGRLLTAYLSSRTDKRRLLPFMGGGIVIFFVLMLFARNPAFIFFCIMGFGFSMAGIYPTTVSFSGDIIKKYALSWSFILTLASLGSILMPSVIGRVAERYGISFGISTIAIAVLLDLCFILMLASAGKKEINEGA